MKILFDKIASGPTYCLSRTDIEHVFTMVPQEWIAPVQQVRMCNSLDSYVHAMFSKIDGTLRVYARHKNKRLAIHGMLTELVAFHLGIKPHGGFQNISTAHQHRIDSIIILLVDRILESLPKQEPLASRGFPPRGFGNFHRPETP